MITDEQINELRERNANRIKTVRENMGSKWVLHPSNSPSKNPDVRVLESFNPYSRASS